MDTFSILNKLHALEVPKNLMDIIEARLWAYEINKPIAHYLVRAPFFVEARVYIKGHMGTGMARCNPKDKFNPETGKRIAYNRALADLYNKKADNIAHSQVK